MTETGEEEILAKLLVDEHDVLKDLETVVNKSLKVFRIEKPSGRIIFQNLGTLTDTQRIIAILAGKYYAHRNRLIPDYSMGISAIGTEIGRPPTALSGPMKELTKKGLVVRQPDRKYRIEYSRMNEAIDYLLQPKK
jgi:DNA-binding MarR family transcriptional regulator